MHPQLQGLAAAHCDTVDVLAPTTDGQVAGDSLSDWQPLATTEDWVQYHISFHSGCGVLRLAMITALVLRTAQELWWVGPHHPSTTSSHPREFVLRTDDRTCDYMSTPASRFPVKLLAALTAQIAAPWLHWAKHRGAFLAGLQLHTGIQGAPVTGPRQARVLVPVLLPCWMGLLPSSCAQRWNDMSFSPQKKNTAMRRMAPSDTSPVVVSSATPQFGASPLTAQFACRQGYCRLQKHRWITRPIQTMWLRSAPVGAAGADADADAGCLRRKPRSCPGFALMHQPAFATSKICLWKKYRC